MRAIYSQTQNNTYTTMNLSTVKWAQWDKTQSRELLVLFICVCSSLCTIVAHDTAQNRPNNFPSCPPDNHHCSDDFYLRERGNCSVGWGHMAVVHPKFYLNSPTALWPIQVKFRVNHTLQWPLWSFAFFLTLGTILAKSPSNTTDNWVTVDFNLGLSI